MAQTRSAVLRREALGRAIKVLRVEQEMSRSELADAAGISYSHLADIENGKKEVSPGRFADIAEALGLSRTELVALQEAYAQDEQPVVEEVPRPRPTRGKSFVVPLMGGEWEAMPGAPEPTRTGPARSPGSARSRAMHPSRAAEREHREVLGDLVLELQHLSPEDLHRILSFARSLSPRR